MTDERDATIAALQAEIDRLTQERDYLKWAADEHLAAIDEDDADAPPRTWRMVNTGQYTFMDFTAQRVGEEVALFRDGVGPIGMFASLDAAEAKMFEMVRTGEGLFAVTGLAEIYEVEVPNDDEVVSYRKVPK